MNLFNHQGMEENLILAALTFGAGQPAMSKAFLLNSGLVLLVGFSVCWGNASI